MAGGLFGQPLTLNIKCIIFALICMFLFLINPSKIINNNYILYFILFIIFVVAYVSMAWYDYYYNCTILPLRRGRYSFTGLFKPPTHDPDKQIEYKETPIDIKRKKLIIYWSHILFIAPLIGYMAYYKNKTNKIVYILLIPLVLMTLIYHGLGIITITHDMISN